MVKQHANCLMKEAYLFKHVICMFINILLKKTLVFCDELQSRLLVTTETSQIHKRNYSPQLCAQTKVQPLFSHSYNPISDTTSVLRTPKHYSLQFYTSFNPEINFLKLHVCLSYITSLSYP